MAASSGKNWQILGAELLEPHSSNQWTQTLANHGAAPFFLNCLACHGAFATYIIQLAVHALFSQQEIAGSLVLGCIFIRCCVGRQLGKE